MTTDEKLLQRLRDITAGVTEPWANEQLELLTQSMTSAAVYREGLVSDLHRIADDVHNIDKATILAQVRRIADKL